MYYFNRKERVAVKNGGCATRPPPLNPPIRQGWYVYIIDVNNRIYMQVL